MAGEQPGETPSSDPRAFSAKPRWQRLIIAFAGPAMNILLAVGLLTGLFMVRYPRIADADGPAIVGFVRPNSPAAQAGIQEGDRIVQMGDTQNPTWEEVSLKEIASAAKELPLIVERKRRAHPDERHPDAR